MPNHVSQDLIIKGNSDVLNEFIIFAKENDNILSANKFIPYPEEYSLLDEQANEARKNKDYSVKDGFNSGGYQWCISNWGTKWGIYGAELVSSKLENKSGRLKYYCESAWSPPIPVIIAMSEKFPSLHFTLKYFERGMGFKGILIVQDGMVLENSSSNSYHGSRGG